MSQTSDQMELREEDIRKHYPAAEALLTGFDHAPRLGTAKVEGGPAPERSPGIPSMRPRFRSTTPGLVTRSTARPGGVHLVDRIEAADDGDSLTSPLQATVVRALRRSLAISMAVGEAFSGLTDLASLKKENLEGRLPPSRSGEFTELLAAESLVGLYSFANALAFLLAPSADGATAEIGSVEEVLTDNAPLALQGALWELDQDIGALAETDAKLVAVVLAYAEALMEKVAARATEAPRLGAFTGAKWRIEADDLPIAGFTPARKARGSTLVMQFKKPEEGVGNHIAKYQAMKLAKMIMAYDFQRQMNPFVELGGFLFTFIGDGMPGTGNTLFPYTTLFRSIGRAS